MANQTLGFSSAVFRKKFRGGMSARSYRDNEIVFSQGDKADAVFYIQSGTVKLTMAATREKKPLSPSCCGVAFLAKAVWEGKLCGRTRRDPLALPISLACRRRARFGSSSATRSLPRCLMHICCLASFESRKTWQINSSISAKSDWHGRCCCLGK